MNLHPSDDDSRVTLGEKLRHVSQRALGIAVALLAIAITLGSLVISALALESNTRVMARVLADNAAASLMFLDNDAASRVLKTLEVDIERTRNEILRELDPNFSGIIYPNNTPFKARSIRFFKYLDGVFQP